MNGDSPRDPIAFASMAAFCALVNLAAFVLAAAANPNDEHLLQYIAYSIFVLYGFATGLLALRRGNKGVFGAFAVAPLALAAAGLAVRLH